MFKHCNLLNLNINQFDIEVDNILLLQCWSPPRPSSPLYLLLGHTGPPHSLNLNTTQTCGQRHSDSPILTELDWPGFCCRRCGWWCRCWRAWAGDRTDRDHRRTAPPPRPRPPAPTRSRSGGRRRGSCCAAWNIKIIVYQSLCMLAPCHHQVNN